MLSEWSALDRSALAIMLVVAVWFIKFLLTFLKDVFIKKDYRYINTDTMELLVERIEDVERQIVSMCKEPFCPTHRQTVDVLDAVVKKMDINASKLDGLVATVQTLKDMGAIHTHSK